MSHPRHADELRAGLEEMHATTACMTRRVLFAAELYGGHPMDQEAWDWLIQVAYISA
jgi:hypothetical protein